MDWKEGEIRGQEACLDSILGQGTRSRMPQLRLAKPPEKRERKKEGSVFLALESGLGGEHYTSSLPGLSGYC